MHRLLPTFCSGKMGTALSGITMHALIKFHGMILDSSSHKEPARYKRHDQLSGNFGSPHLTPSLGTFRFATFGKDMIGCRTLS